MSARQGHTMGTAQQARSAVLKRHKEAYQSMRWEFSVNLM